LVASDELGVYAGVLAGLQEEVLHGRSLEDLRIMLGTQLTLSAPIPMAAEPSMREMRWLERHYLTTPRVPYAQTDKEIVRYAAKLLTDSLEQLRPRGTEIRRDERIDELYGRALERHIQFHVPKVSRVLRGRDRDLLIHSAGIELQSENRVAAPGVMTASKAFYAYRLLEDRIRKEGGFDTRRIGVLQPTRGLRTPDVEHNREWARHVWMPDADVVIDAEREDVNEVLREHAAWVAETAA
jgi:hypothetical protein